MPTNKLYMQQPYLMSSNSVITACGQNEKGFWVHLAETIFHPKGGGQPFDIGTIGTFQVTNVEHDGDEVKHYLGNASSLGQLNQMVADRAAVTLNVDSERRALLTALHTTGHLLTAVLEPKFPLITTKGHHYPNESRVEFSIEANKSISKQEVETYLNEIIKKCIDDKTPVNVIHENELRKIKIGDYQALACGGTHLDNLEQLQSVTLRRITINSATVRVSYEALPLLALYQSKIIRANSTTSPRQAATVTTTGKEFSENTVATFFKPVDSKQVIEQTAVAQIGLTMVNNDEVHG